MAKAAYIGVSNVARKAKKMYIGIGGVAHKVKKAYIGVNGVARLFWSGSVARTIAVVPRNSNSVYGADGDPITGFSPIATNPSSNGAIRYTVWDEENSRFIGVTTSSSSSTPLYIYSLPVTGNTWTLLCTCTNINLNYLSYSSYTRSMFVRSGFLYIFSAYQSKSRTLYRISLSDGALSNSNTICSTGYDCHGLQELNGKLVSPLMPTGSSSMSVSYTTWNNWTTWTVSNQNVTCYSNTSVFGGRNLLSFPETKGWYSGGKYHIAAYYSGGNTENIRIFGSSDLSANSFTQEADWTMSASHSAVAVGCAWGGLLRTQQVGSDQAKTGLFLMKDTDTEPVKLGGIFINPSNVHITKKYVYMIVSTNYSTEGHTLYVCTKDGTMTAYSIPETRSNITTMATSILE